MSFARALSRFEPTAYALLRIITGFLFLWHGTGKIFGFLGDKMEVASQAWFGGVIELVCGVLVMIGLFTRYAAFLASGTMAVAYFQFHWKLKFADYAFLPLVNLGEAAVLYCFLFLYIAARGAGAFSIDGKRGE
jgi:putative oxidoreductase